MAEESWWISMFHRVLRAYVHVVIPAHCDRTSHYFQIHVLDLSSKREYICVAIYFKQNSGKTICKVWWYLLYDAPFSVNQLKNTLKSKKILFLTKFDIYYIVLSLFNNYSSKAKWISANKSRDVVEDIIYWKILKSWYSLYVLFCKSSIQNS